MMSLSATSRRAAIRVEEKFVKVFDTRTLAILEEHKVGNWNYGGVALCDEVSTFVGNYGYVERLSSCENKQRWRREIKDIHSCYTSVCVSDDERWLIAGTSDANLAAPGGLKPPNAAGFRRLVPRRNRKHSPSKYHRKRLSSLSPGHTGR
jgi:hypothetical protein